MILWIVGSIAYLAIAGLFLYIVVRTKRHLAQSKHYSKHPEQFKAEFGSLASDVICSILWPFQIIGFLVYGMKG